MENKLAKPIQIDDIIPALCLYHTSKTSWENKSWINLTVKMTQIMAGLLVLFFFLKKKYQNQIII